MSFTYKPLWKLLIEKNKMKKDLQKEVGLSNATIAKMGKDENISLDVLDKLCSHFGAQPNDIIEHKAGDKNGSN